MISGISALPLTAWGSGIPRANVKVVTATLAALPGVAFPLCVAFAQLPVASTHAPHQSTRYAWSGGFAGSFLGAALCLSLIQVLPAALGVNPKFYFLDFLSIVLMFIVGFFFADRLMWYQYSSETKNVPPRIRKDGAGKAKKKKSKGRSLMATARGTQFLVGITTALVYPLLVLPYYRAQSTTDGVRFAIVCFLHPLYMLVVESMLRENNWKRTDWLRSKPECHDRVFRTYVTMSTVESCLSMMRRLMLGGMHDPTAAILAVVFTAFEEAALRCTMAERDEIWTWIRGTPELTEEERRWQNILQGISSAGAMRNEVTCIITSRLLYLLVQPHRFAFNFGYGADATTMTTTTIIFSSMFLELGLEVAVDAAALQVELESKSRREREESLAYSCKASKSNSLTSKQMGSTLQNTGSFGNFTLKATCALKLWPAAWSSSCRSGPFPTSRLPSSAPTQTIRARALERALRFSRISATRLPCLLPSRETRPQTKFSQS